jgi:basic membrane lipoprotein Med (substrate-binding protein (PBP1-ABC) superfamily)
MALEQSRKGKSFRSPRSRKGRCYLYAAGNSGLGAFDAVEQYGKNDKGEANKFVIGVDSTKTASSRLCLTSMVKRVDNAFTTSSKRSSGQIRRRFPRIRPRQRRGRLRDGRNNKALIRRRHTKGEEARAKIVAGEIKVTDAMAK